MRTRLYQLGRWQRARNERMRIPRSLRGGGGRGTSVGWGGGEGKGELTVLWVIILL